MYWILFIFCMKLQQHKGWKLGKTQEPLVFLGGNKPQSKAKTSFFQVLWEIEVIRHVSNLLDEVTST